MPGRGENVRALFDRRQRKKPRGGDMSRGACEQEALNQMDEDWVMPRLTALDQHISSGSQTQNNQPAVPHRPSPDLPDFQADDQYEDVMPDADTQPAPNITANNFTEYTRGTFYRTRRIRENERWQEVLRPMFLAYMQSPGRTCEWGNNADWNHDWNQSCSCTEGRYHVREIDAVDILSRKKIQVSFCGCTPDQVRLIRQGYIGSSPIRPTTAFSIRLLRLYQSLWNFGTLRIQSFSLALDAFLDASCPLILVRGSNKPRMWRRTFSAAVDAYRHMLRLESELTVEALNLSAMDQLAINCPRCFGPAALTDEVDSSEPNYMVAIDGNFQQRRYQTASQEVEEISLRIPPLFLDPAYVNQWDRERSGRGQTNFPLDPCTVAHTAADDHRTGSSWKGCDETGLLGMVCRHDHVLAFINIIQSGEKSYFAQAMLGDLFKRTYEEGKAKSIGLLYDIGCNFEKGLNRHDLFIPERANNQLKIGTGAFHSYAHNRGCQLQYNPRLNKGWGKTDGEGPERIWSDLDPLIPATRCATKQHRLDALNMKATHLNDVRRLNAGQSTARKFKEVESAMLESQARLVNLDSPTEHAPTGRSIEYFAGQWSRQRAAQLTLWSDNRTQSLQVELAKLFELEEKLRSAHNKLKLLQRQRRRARSEAEMAELATLPASIVAMQEAIEVVIGELGSERFRDLPSLRDPQARLLIRVRVAKERLYEARVGVIEFQKLWDRPGQGTRKQPYMKRVMQDKQKKLRARWNTYSKAVQDYNRTCNDNNRIPSVTLEIVKSYDIEAPFWNIGNLTHPNELWAVDSETQEGINAYLNLRGCQEELRRIAHEVRQMISAALAFEGKLNALLSLSEKSWVPGFPDGIRPIELVQPGRIINKGLWDESQKVLKVLHTSLCLKYCRIWIVWNSHLPSLFSLTQKYSKTDVDADKVLISQWKDLVERSRTLWDCMVNRCVISEELDEVDAIEHEIVNEADDEDRFGGLEVREVVDENEGDDELDEAIE